MKMTQGGAHEYRGLVNDRGRRQKSKLMQGVRRLANMKTFDRIQWEKDCENFNFMYNPKSDFICDNCSNYKCYRK